MDKKRFERGIVVLYCTIDAIARQNCCSVYRWSKLSIIGIFCTFRLEYLEILTCWIKFAERFRFDVKNSMRNDYSGSRVWEVQTFVINRKNLLYVNYTGTRKIFFFKLTRMFWLIFTFFGGLNLNLVTNLLHHVQIFCYIGLSLVTGVKIRFISLW